MTLSIFIVLDLLPRVPNISELIEELKIKFRYCALSLNRTSDIIFSFNCLPIFIDPVFIIAQ